MPSLRLSLLVFAVVAIGCGGVSHSSGPGNDGAATHLPGETERETEILSPLFTDDETIAAASGEELVELVMAIGLARGYASCRCEVSPNGPPANVEELFAFCAPEQSAIHCLSTEREARCISEHLGEVEGLEEYLRCNAHRVRPLALVDFTLCATGMRPDWPPLEDCVAPPEFEAVTLQCCPR